jgi:hydrogenase maturation factor
MLFDPQTAGGLLIAVDNVQADALVTALRSAGVENAVQIGRVVARGEKLIVAS